MGRSQKAGSSAIQPRYQISRLSLIKLGVADLFLNRSSCILPNIVLQERSMSCRNKQNTPNTPICSEITPERACIIRGMLGRVLLLLLLLACLRGSPFFNPLPPPFSFLMQKSVQVLYALLMRKSPHGSSKSPHGSSKSPHGSSKSQHWSSKSPEVTARE